MTQQSLQVNGIRIEVDDQGPRDGDPLLLVMGLGMQLIAWPQELVDDLVARGYRVIRMDNRDVGLSQPFDQLGLPNLAWAALRYAMRLTVRSPYSLQAMADDVIGVLDALGIAKAHLCGASMGGMIVQRVAANRPERVKSLTLMMTTSGARGLPQATPRVRRAMLRRPKSNDTLDIVAHLERLLHLIGSPGYRPDPQRQRERLEASVRRAWRPQGTARQLMAVVADGDRSALLRLIKAPTLILHGQDDPLIPLPHAHDLLGKVPGALIDIVPGMGHDLPAQLLPRFASAIANNARRFK